MHLQGSSVKSKTVTVNPSVSKSKTTKFILKNDSFFFGGPIILVQLITILLVCINLVTDSKRFGYLDICFPEWITIV